MAEIRIIRERVTVQGYNGDIQNRFGDRVADTSLLEAGLIVLYMI